MNIPTKTAKINRRLFIAATAATPLAVVPAVASVEPENPHDDQLEIDILCSICDFTGLSLDDVAYWFRGLHSDVTRQIMENIIKAPRPKWEDADTKNAIISIVYPVAFGSQDRPVPFTEFMQRQTVLRSGQNSLDKQLADLKFITPERFPILHGLGGGTC